MKYTVTDRATCACGREIDVVLNSRGMEYISYHLDPAKKKGWCPMSMILTVKEKSE